MSNSNRRLTRAIAERLGFHDPLRTYAADVVRIERQVARVRAQVADLNRSVALLDAQLLEHRAEVARLYYGARQAARRDAEGKARLLLNRKRDAEDKVRDLEEDITAARRILKSAKDKGAALLDQLDVVRRTYAAAKVVRVADDVDRTARPTSTRGPFERVRHALREREARSALDDEDAFRTLPELIDNDDTVLLARWRAQDRRAA